MPSENGPVHVEFSITRKVMASAIKAELGGFFGKCQKEISIHTSLAETVHPQPPTPVENNNTEGNSIADGMEKQKISRAIDKIFYWVQNRIRQNNFHILCEE